MSCVFCRIRDGQIPAVRVYEDGRTLAIMDINPLNDGHTLVLTRAHVETLYDLPADDCRAVLSAARTVALAVRDALRPDGLNLLQANGPAAFQSVPHFHLHLIPRWADDGKGLDWPLRPGDAARIRELGERIRARMPRES